MSTPDIVEHVAFDKASDFLEYLRPTNSVWGSTLDFPWVFRGHYDADWELVPAAWRSDGRVLLKPIVDSFAQWNTQIRQALNIKIVNQHGISGIPARVLEAVGKNDEHVIDFLLDYVLYLAAEHEAVKQFAQLADELGYPILDQYEALQSASTILTLKSVFDWSMTIFLSPVFTLAQHHGIPTRLLD